MKQTQLTFNKDMMTVNDLKQAGETLESIFNLFDRKLLGGNINDPASWDRDQADDFCVELLAIRERWRTSTQK